MPTIATLGAASARAFGLFGSTAGTDPYFFYNTLLLPGNGTNGAQNNTFLDSSTNNFTITRNGNTTQGTFTPYGSNWSNYFNGTDAYLITGTSSNLTLANNADWTVEAWIFLSASTYQQILFNSGGGSDSWSTQHNCDFAVNSSGFLSFEYSASGTSTSVAGTTATTRNAWNHIAWVFNGTSKTLTTYVNGVRDLNATSVSGYTPPNATPRITIGRTDPTVPNPYQWWVTGYISNVRVVRGSQVYSGATITVPTGPLTAITNTSLLTCQSNRFIDNSSNAFAITVNGSPSVQRFSPFKPSAPYAAGTIGGSGYFDGSGDWLTAPDNAAWDMNTNMTVEAWAYPTTYNTSNQFYIVSQAASGDRAWGFALTNGTLQFYYTTNGNTDLFINSSSFTVAPNQWYHFAFTRTSAGVYTFYVNGVNVGSSTNTSTIFTSSQPLTIGQFGNFNINTLAWQGYLTDVRIVRGSIVYTGNFTPPTTPLTAITNTQLLLSATNGGIIDNAMMNDLETVGNAQISTTQSKFGGSSMYFDGTTSNRIRPPASVNYAFGTGNFTVEAWVYVTNLTTENFVFDTRSSTSTAGMGFSLEPNTGKLRYSGSANNVLTSTGVSANTWTHVAWVRNSGTLTGYINGVSGGSASNSDNLTQTNGEVGNVPFSAVGTNMYIDDLRITKGIARYTANFTPPTAAFPLS